MIPYDSESSSGEAVTNSAQDLDEAGLDDGTIAWGLSFIASKATKTVSLWDWELEYVPDYPTRLAALKIAMTAKGHLSEKQRGNDKAKKHITYILK